MKNTRKLIGAIAILLPLVFLALTTPSCSSIGGVGAEGGYNQATGEITAGVMITFKQPQPDAETLTLLQASGAYGSGTNWGLIAITNDVQRDLVTRALKLGAELRPPARSR